MDLSHECQREFDGASEFERELRPALERIPCFRPPTEHEIDSSYRAYVDGDGAHLCDVWLERAQPRRAQLPAHVEPFYTYSGAMPRLLNGIGFLALVRAALEAGVRFRDELRPEVRNAVAHDFPWMERRHEHIPGGWSPPYQFHPTYRDFINASSSDVSDARARWQLTAAINEVQQHAYSLHAAERFRLPELRLHAQRERELAINYLGHWKPACTVELWRQSIWVLDGLNATIFSMICMERPFRLLSRSGWSALTEREQWHAFVDALGQPQWVLPVAHGPV